MVPGANFAANDPAILCRTIAAHAGEKTFGQLGWAWSNSRWPRMLPMQAAPAGRHPADGGIRGGDKGQRTKATARAGTASGPAGPVTRIETQANAASPTAPA